MLRIIYGNRNINTIQDLFAKDIYFNLYRKVIECTLLGSGSIYIPIEMVYSVYPAMKSEI